MKTVKTKLHHHRKSKTRSAGAVTIPQDAAELWEMDHPADPDLQLYRIERSPKQENL
ncbi:MAG: hypothetical protein WDO13_21255 [Verrucomicrobiota bacterium]